MAKDKYELYRVPIRDKIYSSYCDKETISLCCKYILNDINAEEMLNLLTIINDWTDKIRDCLMGVVIVDNMDTEHLVYLCVAIYCYCETYYQYVAPAGQNPISMLLNKKIINDLLSTLFLNGDWRLRRTDEISELIKAYPIMGPKKKFSWNRDNMKFLIFADMWAKATNQVMTFELYTLLGKEGK